MTTPTTRKAPLDPAAGSVPVPDSNASTTTPEPHETKSIGHDLNSAHDKTQQPTSIHSSGGTQQQQDEEPGMGTGTDSADSRPPDFQSEDAILDAASHGKTTANDTKVSHKDVDDLKREQSVQQNTSGDAEESGPTGLSVGERNMEEEGTSRHDAMQQDLKDGKPSRDGEGSAGLPFDAGN